MRLRPFERGFSVVRLDYGITVFLKQLPSQAAHDFVVFHEQDRGPLSFRTDRLYFSFRSESDFVIRAGEVNLERRPMSRLTVDQNVSRALLHNSIDGGKAQTSSFAQAL